MTAGLVVVLVFAIIGATIVAVTFSEHRSNAIEKMRERQHEIDLKMLDAQIADAKRETR